MPTQSDSNAKALQPKYDPPSGQIVGRQFHLYPVTGKNPDEVLSKLAAEMSQYHVALLNLDTKHGVGERFYYNPLNFNQIFFRHAPVPSKFPLRHR